jgi:hypothetical protein
MPKPTSQHRSLFLMFSFRLSQNPTNIHKLFIILEPVRIFDQETCSVPVFFGWKTHLSASSPYGPPALLLRGLLSIAWTCWARLFIPPFRWCRRIRLSSCRRPCAVLPADLKTMQFPRFNGRTPCKNDIIMPRMQENNSRLQATGQPRQRRVPVHHPWWKPMQAEL